MPRNPNAFVRKTYDLLSDESCTDIASWSTTKDSFIIHNAELMEKELLPKYFKHSNLASFIRQLNTYGFTKVVKKGSCVLEFKHKLFIQGQDKLLQHITRKSAVKLSDSSNVNTLQQSLQDIDILSKLLKDNETISQTLLSVRRQQLRSEQELQAVRKELAYTRSMLRGVMAQSTASPPNAPPPSPLYLGDAAPVAPLPPTLQQDPVPVFLNREQYEQPQLHQVEPVNPLTYDFTNELMELVPPTPLVYRQ